MAEYNMNLKQKTISGAKWSAISTVAIIGISFLQMSLLARIIDTREFGLLSISMIIILIADTISDFGISNSIIQKKDIGNVELSTLYWLNTFIGIFVFLITFFLSQVIATLLKQSDLSLLIKVLSLSFLITPHGQQFRALMQKELEFSKMAYIESLAMICGFVVTIGTALINPIALSAMFGYLIMVASRTAMYATIGRKIYKPQLIFAIRTISENLKFGAFLTADNLINQINSNIATAVLSRTLGAVITGGYNLAFNVAVMPPTKLNPIITKVLFPAFSKIQHDEEKLRKNFYKLLSLVGILNFPILLGLFVVSNNFVIVMFGEKWIFIVPLLKVLCVVGLLRAIGNPIGSLLMAKAKVDLSFKFNVFKFIMFIPTIYFGAVNFGSIGAALGFLVIQFINTILSYFILLKPVLGNSYKEYIESILFPFLLTIPTVIAAYICGLVLEGHASPLYSLIIQVVVGVLAFVLSFSISKNLLILEIKTLLIPKLMKFRN